MAEAPDCCSIAAATIQERGEKLRWAAARLPLASDAEAAHDARVALRRLRATSVGFSDCLAKPRKWGRQLRRAEKELGALRDAEVRLDLLDDVLGPVAVSRDRSDDPRTASGSGGSIFTDPGREIQPGLRGLEMEARRVLADSTAAEIGEFRQRALGAGALQRLQRAAAPPQFQTGGDASAGGDLAQRQLPRLFQRATRPTRTEAGLHRRRGTIRKLRYRLELFAPMLDSGHRAVLQELQELQTRLGRFHDLVVLAGWIDGSARQLRHELRPALRRLALRVELERQAAKEAAESELARLDDVAWWAAAEAACLGSAEGTAS
ncbi:MAG: CHAD domain-containing protein [Candidatus Dormibacteria bacterium]